MVKRLTVILATVALLVASLASAGYAARNTHLMEHWHPMFVEPALGYFGLSFFGHEHTPQELRIEGGAFVDAPITSCWNYDFLERDCDGPNHYKAFLADGSTRDSKVGAYKGDTSPTSPPRAKACATNTNPYRKYCVSDYRDDGKTVWIDTGRDLDRHTLAIGCPGPVWSTPVPAKTLERSMKTLLAGAVGMLALQMLLVGYYLVVNQQDPIILNPDRSLDDGGITMACIVGRAMLGKS